MAAEPNNLLRHIRHTCAMLISAVLLTACQTSTPLLLPHRPSLSTSPLAPSLTCEIQAQGAEMNVAAYQSFVVATTHTARQTNPTVTILAGLSTNPGGQHVTATALYAAVRATHRTVNGYWLNIPAGGLYCPRCGIPQPQVAIALIKLLEQLPLTASPRP